MSPVRRPPKPRGKKVSAQKSSPVRVARTEKFPPADARDGEPGGNLHDRAGYFLKRRGNSKP